MGRIKIAAALALLLALGVFVAQNVQVIDVRFLVWKLEMSRAILMLGVLAVGVALGWLGASLLSLRD